MFLCFLGEQVISVFCLCSIFSSSIIKARSILVSLVLDCLCFSFVNFFLSATASFIFLDFCFLEGISAAFFVEFFLSYFCRGKDSETFSSSVGLTVENSCNTALWEACLFCLPMQLIKNLSTFSCSLFIAYFLPWRYTDASRLEWVSISLCCSCMGSCSDDFDCCYR